MKIIFIIGVTFFTWVISLLYIRWEIKKILTQNKPQNKPPRLDVRADNLPLLDDWVDGKPDAWDYEKVLAENNVTIEWNALSTPAGVKGCWSLNWRNGSMHIGQTSEINACKAAAMFVSLWLRGVSASFADKLMDGYLAFLEIQDGSNQGATVEVSQSTLTKQFYITVEEKVAKRLNLQDGDSVAMWLQRTDGSA